MVDHNIGKDLFPKRVLISKKIKDQLIAISTVYLKLNHSKPEKIYLRLRLKDSKLFPKKAILQVNVSLPSGKKEH